MSLANGETRALVFSPRCNIEYSTYLVTGQNTIEFSW